MDFRNAVIKADRELRRDPAYRSEFPNTPIRITELPVALSEEELAASGFRLESCFVVGSASAGRSTAERFNGIAVCGSLIE